MKGNLPELGNCTGSYAERHMTTEQFLSDSQLARVPESAFTT